jgi:hypothetical protein
MKDVTAILATDGSGPYASIYLQNLVPAICRRKSSARLGCQRVVPELVRRRRFAYTGKARLRVNW